MDRPASAGARGVLDLCSLGANAKGQVNRDARRHLADETRRHGSAHSSTRAQIRLSETRTVQHYRTREALVRHRSDTTFNQGVRGSTPRRPTRKCLSAAILAALPIAKRRPADAMPTLYSAIQCRDSTSLETIEAYYLQEFSPSRGLQKGRFPALKECHRAARGDNAFACKIFPTSALNARLTSRLRRNPSGRELGFTTGYIRLTTSPIRSFSAIPLSTSVMSEQLRAQNETSTRCPSCHSSLSV